MPRAFATNPSPRFDRIPEEAFKEGRLDMALVPDYVAVSKSVDGRQVLAGNEAFFRSQEHTYRAVALFRRAGGQLPASSGVCGSLALAQTSLSHARDVVATPSTPPPASHLIEGATGLHESAENWSTVIESMITDYQCPNPHIRPNTD